MIGLTIKVVQAIKILINRLRGTKIETSLRVINRSKDLRNIYNALLLDNTPHKAGIPLGT